MNPAEAKAIAHFLLAEMVNEVSTTNRVFGAVPGGRLDYKPDARSKTALRGHSHALRRGAPTPEVAPCRNNP